MRADTSPVSPEFAEYIAFDEFRSGLPAGRFHVVVNPKLAVAYVRRRLVMNAIVIAVIALGVLLAVSGHAWVGAAVVFGAILVNRLVSRQAAKILLHFATQNEAAYLDATTNGVMEVRRV